ncbi:MAG: DUF512 domain-containing protein [Clostridium sp.]
MHLYAIRNDFFGESITVAGLITGQDLKQISLVVPASGRAAAASNLHVSGVARRYSWMTSPAPMIAKRFTSSG